MKGDRVKGEPMSIGWEYSFDETAWHGMFRTREEAVKEAHRKCDAALLIRKIYLRHNEIIAVNGIEGTENTAEIEAGTPAPAMILRGTKEAWIYEDRKVCGTGKEKRMCAVG